MLIVICSFLFFFGMGIRIINRIHMEQMKSKCEVHKWEMRNGSMICSKCLKYPKDL